MISLSLPRKQRQERFSFCQTTMFNPFTDKLIEDDRDHFLSLEYLDYQIRFYAPKGSFYIQMTLILLFQILACCIMCSIIYKGIVCKNKPKKTSTQGFLVGFGIVIPLSIIIPFQILNMTDIRSLCSRMALVALPMTISLTCFEAMFGFTKVGTSKSMKDYILAEAFVVRPELKDGVHIKFDNNRYWRAMKLYIFWLLVLSCFDSWLSSVNYEPFTVSRPANETFIAFEPAQLYNTFFQALVSNLVLLFSFYGVAAAISQMTGRQYQETITQNPMFSSESPSDFWGRRWNLIIHNGLKQGVYKPVRWNTNSMHLAYLAAFFMSGMLHELVWIIVYFRTDKEIAEGDSCLTCYNPSFGKQLLFFGWNGILLVLESLLGDRLSFLKRYLPHYLICHLVVLLALPVGHLFTGDLNESGYYKHLGIALFRITVTKIR